MADQATETKPGFVIAQVLRAERIKAEAAQAQRDTEATRIRRFADSQHPRGYK